MGNGKFYSSLRTKGGKGDIVTLEDILNNTKDAKIVLQEMKTDNINFSKDKIIFVASLENGSKIFLEKGNKQSGLEHIYCKHSREFGVCFNTTTKEQISKVLLNNISKGKLISSNKFYKNGKISYRNIYHLSNDSYAVVYAIAENGYIVTAFPYKL